MVMDFQIFLDLNEKFWKFSAILKIIISQPFAAKILTNSILNHFREGDPPKPLVLMLHGPTGVGKVRYFKGQLIFEFSTVLYAVALTKLYGYADL